MSLVSKTVIMTQSDTFQGQAIKKKHKQISDLVSPEYDKQIEEMSLLFLLSSPPPLLHSLLPSFLCLRS